MLKKHRDDEQETPRDMEIESWFQPLGEPPVAQEPPGARLRMLAQIEERRKRRWWLSWLSLAPAPALAMGLAAGLLLAFGLNLLAGPGFLTFNRPGTQQVMAIRTGLPTFRADTRTPDSDVFRMHIEQRIPAQKPLKVIGFAPPPPRVIFFRIGMLYADALAALHQGTADTAMQPLTWIAEELREVQAPALLLQYINMIHREIQEQSSRIDQSTLMLMTFAPFYLETYDHHAQPTASLLFELGTWSENLYLAAATKDVERVKRARVPQNVQKALQPLNLPPKSLALLGQIRNLIDKPQLSDSDLKTVYDQVQDFQNLLSR